MRRNTYQKSIDPVALYISIGRCGDTGKPFQECPCAKCDGMFADAQRENSYIDAVLAEYDAQRPADNAMLRARADQLAGRTDAEGVNELAQIGDALARDGGAIGDERSTVETPKPTPPICDIYGKVKGARTEPGRESSREEAAHLGRYGF